MKRIFLFIVLVLTITALPVSAQHLSFKGHQISGDVDTLINALVAEGYWLDPVIDGPLYGTYCDMPASFTFYATPLSNTVYQISIEISPHIKTDYAFKQYWHSLTNNQKKSIIKSNKYNDSDREWWIIVHAERGISALSLLVAEKTAEYAKKGLERAMRGENNYSILDDLNAKSDQSYANQAYYDVKDALSIVYGKPRRVKEKEENGHRECTFLNPNGTIVLARDNYSSTSISIVLIDKKNQALYNEEHSRLNDRSKEERDKRIKASSSDI